MQDRCEAYVLLRRVKPLRVGPRSCFCKNAILCLNAVMSEDCPETGILYDFVHVPRRLAGSNATSPLVNSVSEPVGCSHRIVSCAEHLLQVTVPGEVDLGLEEWVRRKPLCQPVSLPVEESLLRVVVWRLGHLGVPFGIKLQAFIRAVSLGSIPFTNTNWFGACPGLKMFFDGTKFQQPGCGCQAARSSPDA